MKPSIPSLRNLGILSLFLTTSSLVRADNLVTNGDFENKTAPFAGWFTDYAFTGNSFYVGNKDRVTVENGKAVIKPAGQEGAKIECRAITLEPGFQYNAKFDVKGGPFRIYFAGYKWKPGIRPHDNPELGELRMIYKSEALSANSSSWKNESIKLPAVKLSPQAKAALKEVRFITLFVWMLGEGSIDNVVVTKTSDPEMKFLAEP